VGSIVFYMALYWLSLYTQCCLPYYYTIFWGQEIEPTENQNLHCGLNHSIASIVWRNLVNSIPLQWPDISLRI
jgi:hypothetical protein